jgi:hypothetical protein
VLFSKAWKVPTSTLIPGSIQITKLLIGRWHKMLRNTPVPMKMYSNRKDFSKPTGLSTAILISCIQALARVTRFGEHLFALLQGFPLKATDQCGTRHSSQTLAFSGRQGSWWKRPVHPGCSEVHHWFQCLQNSICPRLQSSLLTSCYLLVQRDFPVAFSRDSLMCLWRHWRVRLAWIRSVDTNIQWQGNHDCGVVGSMQPTFLFM